MTNILRPILLGAGLLGFGSLGWSVHTQQPLFTYLGFFLLTLGLVGSFLSAPTKWGKFSCFWFIVAYDDKHMPLHVHGQANALMLILTLATAYAAITNLVLPGLPGLTQYFFYLCFGFGIALIGMVIANARSFPSWMAVLDYNKRKE